MKKLIIISVLFLSGCFSEKTSQPNTLPSSHWANKPSEIIETNNNENNQNYKKEKQERKTNYEKMVKEEEEEWARRREEYKRKKELDKDNWTPKRYNNNLDNTLKEGIINNFDKDEWDKQRIEEEKEWARKREEYKRKKNISKNEIENDTIINETGIEEAKVTCLDIGFKKGTEKFSECVLELTK